MAGFVRVRSAKRGDPKHEFYVSEVEARVREELYHVVDGKPVSSPRPVKYVVPKSGGTTEEGEA
jgi:hypothetical protein